MYNGLTPHVCVCMCASVGIVLHGDSVEINDIFACVTDRPLYMVLAEEFYGKSVGERAMFVGCLTSQQHASVSQGRICSDNFMCCHTEVEVADQTFYLTQSLTSGQPTPVLTL